MSEIADRNDKEKFYKGHYGITGTFAQKIKELAVAHDYIYTDGLLAIDSTDGEVIITLPLMAEIEEREYRHIFPIMHVAGDNNVKIQCSGSETFANGATFFNLGKGLFCFDLFVLQTATYSTFGLYSPLTIKANHTYAGTFDTALFATTAIAPLATVKNNDQSEIFLLQGLSDGTFTSCADSTPIGGDVVVTDAAPHGLTTGEVITIAGTTSYNNEYVVTVLSTTTFSIPTPLAVGTEAGTWIRSARCTCLLTGRYKVGYQMTAVSTGGAAWVITGSIFKNGSLLANTSVVRGGIVSGTESLALPMTDIELAAGDFIDLRVDNDSLTGALTIAMLSVEITV